VTYQSLQYKPIQKNLAPGVRLVQEIDNQNSPLKYVGFRLLTMEKNAVFTEDTEGYEVCVVALTGQIQVSESNHIFSSLGTRTSVFDRIPTDSVYISNNRIYEVKAESDNVKVALCYSPSTKQRATKWIKAADISIEDRGKYANKRHVHNILPDDDNTANSLLVVEVYTNGGNFSSYPPHRHDHDNLPEESFLEESYYHEIDPGQGFIFQRVYTDDRSLDQTMSIENQDVVVVPKGYHPVGVPDGYTSYYLNVMAGPERIWKFHNDPNHEWILERK
jgi:5-deoxy-glucuronate isomerase